MSDKKLHAKHLFFQTELNKTQIADILNISRRTLHYWIREGNWQRLKNSSENMPSIIAENCYHIMAHLTNSYLSERRLTNPVTPKEIDALHKLTLTINKLKSRTTLNENVEMLAYFVDKIKSKAPEVAEQIAPFVEEYLEERASIYAGHVAPPHFNDIGYIPMNDSIDYTEQQLDASDVLAWDTEHYNNTIAKEYPNLPPLPIEEETFQTNETLTVTPDLLDASTENVRESLLATKQSHETPITLPPVPLEPHKTTSAMSEQHLRNKTTSKPPKPVVNQPQPPQQKNLRKPYLSRTMNPFPELTPTYRQPIARR